MSTVKHVHHGLLIAIVAIFAVGTCSNSSEKRLARVLLLLARFGKEGKPETIVPKISQETLAEMVGTIRARVTFFMNRFKKLGLKLGFIDHSSGDLQVHRSLLNIVLHD
jgi:CRP-like cAMP-binding protein